jgi:flagellar hook-associated protein 2
MSDFSIPGVSSKYNTDKLIEDLMKLERVPLTREKERIEQFELQKRNWQELSRNLARVQESARSLYGFQNPFLDRIASSDNESILTATATREAVEETRSVSVKQVATADRFLSDSLDSSYRVPSGDYSFTVGEKEVGFTYSGGTLQDFSSVLERRSQGLLRASVVRNTPSTQVLLIEGTKTGTSNRISFSGKAREFALEAGILSRSVTTARSFTPGTDGSLTIAPQTRQEIPFRPPIIPEEGFILEFQVRIEKLGEEEYVRPEPPPGPSAPDPGGVTLQDLTLKNLPAAPSLPSWEPPPPPEKNFDMKILTLTGGGSARPLAPLRDEEAVQTVRVPVSGALPRLDALVVDNVNTHRVVTVSQIRLYNPEARGDMEPKNPVATASDAVIEIDGIEVIRESNEIDDVIQGVSLNLRRPGDFPVEIDITPDREAVKNTIIEFVGYYNQLISQINIYTGRDESVVNELDYLSDDEREKALEQLGLFQGESSLTQMKTRMQRIMMDPYTTREGSELSLLAQAGISTNSAAGGGLRASRLRGYLEIDEGALDTTLETRLQGVKDLFGYDSDGDLVVDQGAGFSIDEYIRPYVQTGGIITYKTSAIDGQIDRSDSRIESLERSLERKEQQLRREYGMMEGALRQMEDSSRALDSFNNQNSDR